MTPPVPARSASPARMIGVLLTDVTCFAIVMPLLASYASARHASSTTIGLLVASYSAMHFLLAPAWGRLSDRIGRRPVLLIGLAMAAHQGFSANLFTLVSDTIRTYLEERFDLRAPERTTEEFLFELQSSMALLPPQKETLGDFLARCDLVKFARYEPVQSELEELHRCAERLVNETEPPAPLAPGAHAAGPNEANPVSESVSK